MEFNLNNIYRRVFGVQPNYDLESTNEGLKQPQDNASFAPGVLPTSKYGSSEFYKQDAVGRYYFMPVKLGDVELQYPIIRIQGRKNIVETQLTERKGSVIELINQDNYRIYIRGFIIDHQNNYPEDAIKDIVNLFELNTHVALRSVLTDLFLTENDSVVITDINFPEVSGVQNVKPYEINLISNNIFELEIN